MKVKALVAALALVSAGQVFAAAAPGSTGDGELVLNVYDSVAKVSYMRDLGLNISNFLPTSTAAQSSFTAFTADANWASFIGQTTAANLTWSVYALDTLGTGTGGKRYLSTSTDAVSVAQNMFNSKLNTFSQTDDYINANNNMLVAPANADYAAEVSTIATFANDGNAYYGGFDKWKGNSAFNTSAALDTNVGFLYLTNNGTTSSAKLGVNGAIQFGASNPEGISAWNLASNGTLNYIVPTPAVPEADTYVMFGLGGLIAAGMVRRKKAKLVA